MAMSDEELKNQLDILTLKTEDNPYMVYKVNAVLNKGLNPEYFKGNNTKIVNAINMLAEDCVRTSEVAELISDKINEVLLDVSNYENGLIWENLKELMEIDTIIEGMQRILQGKQQDKILGISPDDIGKVLSVSQADDGEMMVKAIDNILGAESVEYEHENHPEISNINEAIDKLFDLHENIEIDWDMINNKPELGNSLELNGEGLHLKSEDDEVISTVELATNMDIDDIVNNLL